MYGDDDGGSGYKAPKPAFYSPYGYLFIYLSIYPRSYHNKQATPPVAKGPTVKAPSIKQLMEESKTGFNFFM